MLNTLVVSGISFTPIFKDNKTNTFPSVALVSVCCTVLPIVAVPTLTKDSKLLFRTLVLQERSDILTEKITFGTTNVIPKRILENSESLQITFDSALTYEQIKTLLSSKDNTKVITYTRESEGQVPYTHDYTGYTELDPTIGVGECKYTVTLNQPNLEQKYDELNVYCKQLKSNMEYLAMCSEVEL